MQMNGGPGEPAHPRPLRTDPPSPRRSTALTSVEVELTVLVFIVNTVNPAVGEDLEVKSDAHVAVEPPHSLDAQQIVTLPVQLRFLPRDPQHGAREQALPSFLQQSCVRPAARQRVRGHDPQQEAQQERRGQRPVRRAGLAGHTDEEPLRNGHPVYLRATWSKLMTLKIPLFLFCFLRHGGRRLFWERGSGLWA